MASSSIEWTDATWNPVTGCTRVSRGCDFCYAVSMSKRLASMGVEKYSGLVDRGKRHFNGRVRVHPSSLDIPLRTRKPTMWFVNSMSDLFHREVPEEFIVDIFEVMARTPWHTYQVLTKRPERMRRVVPRVWDALSDRVSVGDGRLLVPLQNVWLGTSVEDLDAVRRIPDLVETPAAMRFLSCEPLLGPLHDIDLTGLQWVIVGGESGSQARPTSLAWIENIVSQCRKAGVACFVKQLGANPIDSGTSHQLALRSRKGSDPDEWPGRLRVREYPELSSRTGHASLFARQTDIRTSTARK